MSSQKTWNVLKDKVQNIGRKKVRNNKIDFHTSSTNNGKKSQLSLMSLKVRKKRRIKIKEHNQSSGALCLFETRRSKWFASRRRLFKNTASERARRRSNAKPYADCRTNLKAVAFELQWAEFADFWNFKLASYWRNSNRKRASARLWWLANCASVFTSSHNAHDFWMKTHFLDNFVDFI